MYVPGLKIQIRIIEESEEEEDKGMAGLIRDCGTLDFLVDRVNSIDDPYQKAARLLYTIAAHHPFIRGIRGRPSSLQN